MEVLGAQGEWDGTNYPDENGWEERPEKAQHAQISFFTIWLRLVLKLGKVLG